MKLNKVQYYCKFEGSFVSFAQVREQNVPNMIKNSVFGKKMFLWKRATASKLLKHINSFTWVQENHEMVEFLWYVLILVKVNTCANFWFICMISLEVRG